MNSSNEISGLLEYQVFRYGTKTIETNKNEEEKHSHLQNKGIKNSLKEKEKKKKNREGGICHSHSEKTRYSSKPLISLDEFIV